MSGPLSLVAPSMRRVERAAEHAIVRCLRSRSLKAVPLPVPVEQWVEGVFGFDFEITDLTAYGTNVLGVASVAERKIRISESAVRHEGRFRFTVGHELGHMILHEKLAPLFADTDRDLGNLSIRIEREADRFAAAFLMPALCVAEELEKSLKDVGLAIQELGAGDINGAVRQTLGKNIIPRMASVFSVSRQAMMYRLGDLRSGLDTPVLPRRVIDAITRSQATPEAFGKK